MKMNPKRDTNLQTKPENYFKNTENLFFKTSHKHVT